MANILVVDDDLVIQLTIQRVLERAGHVVTVANDGQKALAKFRSERFDLLVLDIFMPGMDGLETMRLILKEHPQLPIVMTSGRPQTPAAAQEPDYLTMAMKLGAVSALPKPFKPATLLSQVADALAAASHAAGGSKPGHDALPSP